MNLTLVLCLLSLVLASKSSIKTSGVEGSRKRPKSLLTQPPEQGYSAPTNAPLIARASQRRELEGILPSVLESFPIGRRDHFSLLAKFIFIIERKLMKASLCRLVQIFLLQVIPFQWIWIVVSVILPGLSDAFWLLLTSSNEIELANLGLSSTLILALMHMDGIAFHACINILDKRTTIWSYFVFAIIEAGATLFLNEILCAKLMLEDN